MNAVPESEMRVGIAVDIEIQRILEHAFIEVGRAVEHHDALPFTHALAANLGIGHGRAPEVMQRTGPAQHFLNGRAQRLRVGPQPCQQLGLAQQFVHPAGNQSARGFVAGHGELHKQRCEFHFRQLVSVHFLVDQ